MNSIFIWFASLFVTVFLLIIIFLAADYTSKAFKFLKAWFSKRREIKVELCDHYFPIAEALTADLSDLPYLKCLKCNSPLGEVTGGKLKKRNH